MHLLKKESVSKFLYYIVLVVLLTSCTIGLEENTRVLTQTRVVDNSGQPLSGVTVKVFGIQRTDNPFAQLGNGVTDINGAVNIPSFHLATGTTQLVYNAAASPRIAVTYFIDSRVYENNLSFDTGDVRLLTAASLTINFVNTTMTQVDVPYELTYKVPDCRQYINAQGAVDSARSFCYEPFTGSYRLTALSTTTTRTLTTLLDSQVLVNYVVNNVRFTEVIAVTALDTSYEINY